MERSNNNWFRPNSSKGVFGGTRERGLTTSAPAVNSSFQTLEGGDGGSDISWDYSLGYNAKVTLSGLPGARVLSSPTNVSDGDYGTLIVIQDGIGAKTLTLPASFKVISGGGGAITLTATPNAKDVISWTYDGTDFLVSFGLNFT